MTNFEMGGATKAQDDANEEDEKNKLVEELEHKAQILDEYQMLKWCEENKARLIKHGMWMPAKEHKTIMEELGEIEEMNEQLKKDIADNEEIKYPEDFKSEQEEELPEVIK